MSLFSVQFDEGRAVLDKDITAENIQTFVSGEQLPLVVEFTDEVCEYSNYKYLSRFVISDLQQLYLCINSCNYILLYNM